MFTQQSLGLKSLFLLLCSFSFLFPQITLLDENFEGTWWPPAGWVVYNEGGGGDCRWDKRIANWPENGTYYAGLWRNDLGEVVIIG